MVLIRVLLICFLTTFCHLVSAQVLLSGVKVTIQESQSGFGVQAIYQVEIPDDIKTLNLKVLTFGDANIEGVIVNGVEIEINEAPGLNSIQIPLLAKQKPKDLTLSYQVKPGKKGEIPIFYGDWQSTSSDQDFFQIQLKANHKTNLLFPTDGEHSNSGELKVISASLPAATSMIRVEQESDTGIQWIKRVDQIVIVLFTLIGALIWFNRKRLIYG